MVEYDNNSFEENEIDRLKLELFDKVIELDSNKETISLLETKLEQKNIEIEKIKNKHIRHEKILEQAYLSIKQKETELIEQKQHIQAQADSLEITNEEILKKSVEILKKNNEIISSITYALRIQNAVLPNKHLIEEILPDHFVFAKARDIVSGDFYYVKKIKNIILIAVADCTGHGVPGALMCMLSITLLNEIVRNAEIRNSASVLNELRTQIKISLQQSGEKGEQQDGLDIAFCAIDTETNMLSFAGAKNSLFFFRDNNLFEFKANNMPVGVYPKEKPFTEHLVKLEKNDVIYLFSDGFHSQFGGAKNEVYKKQHFLRFLTEIHRKEINIQKESLKIEFDKWIGYNKQTDDVLVVGFKI